MESCVCMKYCCYYYYYFCKYCKTAVDTLLLLFALHSEELVLKTKKKLHFVIKGGFRINTKLKKIFCRWLQAQH